MNKYLNNGFVFLLKTVLFIVCARWVYYHFGINEWADKLINNLGIYL